MAAMRTFESYPTSVMYAYIKAAVTQKASLFLKVIFRLNNKCASHVQ